MTGGGGNHQGGNVLGAKRLGEEMVWGRNDSEPARLDPMSVITAEPVNGSIRYFPINLSGDTTSKLRYFESHE